MSLCELPRSTRDRRAAFSLVELSVVLAIIGLIAGGVMATSSYLKSAQQTAVINEGKSYLNAIKQFQTKYDGGVPGDLGNASTYWTASTTCPALSAPDTVCNGNGNGVIESGNEIFYVWRHLQLSGFISGNFSGAPGPLGANDAVIDLNVPSMSMEGVTAWVDTPGATGYVTGNANYYDGYYGHVVHIAKEIASVNPWAGFLSPAEAYELDNKFDDGQPDKGWIRTRANIAGCVSGTSYLASAIPGQCLFYLTNV